MASRYQLHCEIFHTFLSRIRLLPLFCPLGSTILIIMTLVSSCSFGRLSKADALDRLSSALLPSPAGLSACFGPAFRTSLLKPTIIRKYPEGYHCPSSSTKGWSVMSKVLLPNVSARDKVLNRRALAWQTERLLLGKQKPKGRFLFYQKSRYCQPGFCLPDSSFSFLTQGNLVFRSM